MFNNSLAYEVQLRDGFDLKKERHNYSFFFSRVNQNFWYLRNSHIRANSVKESKQYQITFNCVAGTFLTLLKCIFLVIINKQFNFGKFIDRLTFIQFSK